MSQSQITINFASEQTTTGADLSLALDTDYNTATYGQTKTTFAPNETAYLQLICDKTADAGAVVKMTSLGVIFQKAANIQYPVDEDLTFANVDSATLGLLPSTSITWEWLGNNGGRPLFNGQIVTVPSAVVGVLHCEYKTAGDRLGLTVSYADMAVHGLGEVSVVAVVTQNGKTASAIVTFSIKEAVTAVATDLEVRSFCDDSILVGAQVYLDSVSKGVTNGNGLCYLGMLTPGVEYSIVVTKDGYISTDSDILSNDRFVISIS